MHLTIHGHFYQPPRENPWTGRIPRQASAHPHHDWNARITAECYAPNARSRVLDAERRIEEIVNNYEWINFDFGPTLLRWLEKTEPRVYRAILQADARARTHNNGHGNAIAQAYNHMILPLATYRDKRTQVRWGLRDFEHRFGRKSESIWLPETAVDLETLQVLAELDIRYIILAPHQARRIRRLPGTGAWTDVSGGRIDPRRAYRVLLRGTDGRERSIDAFFYDGPLSVAISFEHLLQSAPGLTERILSAAKGGSPNTLVSASTDGEVYGHHEPFGDMCLAYAVARELPRRAVEITNYGCYLDQHPPQYEVELDLGGDGEGTSWSCAHGVARWARHCGCSTGGQPGWDQKWRSPLRRGLNHLRDRLLEIFLEGVGELVHDPWEARDDYVNILLTGGAGRQPFIDSHARRSLSEAERRLLWRLLESQHQGMLMFTSCAWFFADISGIEVQQNLAHAARAIELAQPYSRESLEQSLLGTLAEARSNRPDLVSGAEVYRRFVAPMRKGPLAAAFEAAALVAAGRGNPGVGSVTHAVEIRSTDGRFAEGALRVHLAVCDTTTDEQFSYSIEVTKDPDRLMRLKALTRERSPAVRDSGASCAMRRAEEPGPPGKRPSGEIRSQSEIESDPAECSIDDLEPDVRAQVVRSLLAEVLAREEARFDEIFESSRPLIERYAGGAMILPPIWTALATDVIQRRAGRAARELARIDPRRLAGTDIKRAVSGIRGSAEGLQLSITWEPLMRVCEDALAANLSNVQEIHTDDLQRSRDLVRAADENGVKFQRTYLEEMVYALLSHHRDLLAARLAGESVPDHGIDPDVLIQLAEVANVSLRSFGRAPIQCD